MAKDDEDSLEKLSRLNDELKKIDVHEIHAADEENAMEAISEFFKEDETFAEAVEQMLSNINEISIDPAGVQSHLMLLIKKYLSRTKSTKLGRNKEVSINENLIGQSVAELTNLLISQRLKNTNSSVPDKNKILDHYLDTTNESKKNLTRLVKSFLVYEIYKVLNPHRIAGETKQENFIHNVIVGGIEKAKNYTGGSKKEIEAYSPSLLKSLENKSPAFKKPSHNKGFER